MGTGQLLVIYNICSVRGLRENGCKGEARGAAGSGPGEFRIEGRSQQWT
jgi:hypothetical protein